VPASTTVYFDTTDATNCLALLPTNLRVAEDLAWLAAESEADVINHFTREITRAAYVGYPAPVTLPISFRTTSVYTDLGNGRAVYLKNYTVDPSQCTDPLFMMALRRTVAAVYRWRVEQMKRDVQVKQSSNGGGGAIGSGQRTFTTYDALPPAWDRYLKPYDTRETKWGL
jgi:hypothetical protein